MSTRYVLTQQIIDDLDRTDINSQISTAIETAIRFYEHERFWFNTSYAQTVTLSQSVATLSFTALPKRYLEIDRIRLKRASNWYTDLMARDYAYLMMSQDNLTVAEPMEYCVYGDAIQFDSMSNDDHTLVIDGLVSLGSTASNSYSTSSSVPWFNEARDLIRATAKKQLQIHVIRDAENAALSAAAEKGAYAMLKSKTNQRVATGYVRPTQF